MIYGIGTDAVEVRRIEAALARHGTRFLERILGPREQAVHARRAARSVARGTMFVATRFAAKEAISKALGLGMHAPMHWRAVQIVNGPTGRPEVLADANLQEFLHARDLTLHISVSDLEHLALAYAVAESRPRSTAAATDRAAPAPASDGGEPA